MIADSKIKSIIARIQAGEFELFREVKSDELKEYIISQLDFSQITLSGTKEPDHKKKKALLKIVLLENMAFKSLSIQHCAVLTDRHVATLLKNSPGLKKLKLVNCPKLTDKISVSIEKYTPILMSLTLLQLPQFFGLGKKVIGLFNRKITYEPINLQPLTRLNVSENLQLIEISIQCPYTHLASTKRNPQLMKVSLFSENLEAWGLSYCDSMNDAALAETTRSYSLMPRLNLQGCRSIQSSLLHCVNEYAPCLFPLLSPKDWFALAKSAENTNIFDKIHNDFMATLADPLVDLSKQHLSDIDLIIIVSLLNRYATVKILNLSGTQFSEQSIRFLCESLQNNTSLEILDVRNCNVPDSVAALFVTILQKNTTLQLINLDCNPCTENITQNITALCLERCKKMGDFTSAIPSFLNHSKYCIDVFVFLNNLYKCFKQFFYLFMSHFRHTLKINSPLIEQ